MKPIYEAELLRNLSKFEKVGCSSFLKGDSQLLVVPVPVGGPDHDSELWWNYTQRDCVPFYIARREEYSLRHPSSEGFNGWRLTRFYAVPKDYWDPPQLPLF